MSSFLAGRDGGDIGSLAMQAGAVAGGDEDATIVERMALVPQAIVTTSARDAELAANIDHAKFRDRHDPIDHP